MIRLQLQKNIEMILTLQSGASLTDPPRNPKLIELLKSGRYKYLGEAEKLLKELGEQ